VTDEELPLYILILHIQISAVGLILRETPTKYAENYRYEYEHKNMLQCQNKFKLERNFK